MDDEDLLRRAEAALTEIKVNQGLSEAHASVLAALRIRLKGDAGASLDQLLESAGDVGSPGGLDDLLTKREGSRETLDDVLGRPEKPKPDWPS